MISDDILLKSDIICLHDIWLDSDDHIEESMIPNYELFLNSNGRGKGVAANCKKGIFRHEHNIKRQNMQLSKFMLMLWTSLFYTDHRKEAMKI